MQSYRDALEAINKNFKENMEEKDQLIAEKEGEIVGLKLKVQLVEEKN